VSASSFLKRRWEKNWPELHAALRGGCPRFIVDADPVESPGTVPVFCYHAVDSQDFEADLQFLDENGYVAIGADALLDHLHARRPAPARCLVITLDDGPSNLYRVAFPLLRKYSQTAVAFIAPQFHRHSAVASATDAPCSWEEIRAMQEAGAVDFQSHTFEHRYVPRWPEPAPLTGIALAYHEYSDRELSLEDDLRLARATLEAELGKPVRHLAFPRYEGTAEAVQAGLKCGYEGFWWGMVPRHPTNAPGDDGRQIVRLSGEFLRRLPGRGRKSLMQILTSRYDLSSRVRSTREAQTRSGPRISFSSRSPSHVSYRSGDHPS
jgi:peptidoglycan/xylan/chitin deacetylase (PgdA/CDA1 family)